MKRTAFFKALILPHDLVQIPAQIKVKARAYADKHGFLFIESSAKKGLNVRKVFKVLVSEIHAAHLEQYERHRDSVMLNRGGGNNRGDKPQSETACVACGL